ncbi:MAG: hypothetical protein ACYCVG_02015, partial [Leptospirillum sp.]|jgi:hypothetical protein
MISIYSLMRISSTFYGTGKSDFRHNFNVHRPITERHGKKSMWNGTQEKKTRSGVINKNLTIDFWRSTCQG